MDSLLNTAPCGFVSFADDGTIVDINQTLADMLGYGRVELLGWHMEKILPPGGRIFYHTHVFPLLKMHGTVDEVYLPLRTRDGRDVPMLLNGVRRDRDNALLSDCVFVRMLQRHEYEDQLLQARRLAEEASAAKAKFLSMMSHDLRTPLTTIYGNASLLATDVHGPLNDEQRGDVETIRDACRVLSRMISDILEFAQLESGRVRLQLQTTAVAGALARAAALLGVQVADAGLTLVSEPCPADAMVNADPDKLQQILLNLLTNAIKFTPAGGTIASGCRVDDDRVQMYVRDTGVGIAPEHLHEIFAPFVQIDQHQPATAPPTTIAIRGVGLGLAISRELARAMEGDIRAESTPGKGSTFVIELPMVKVPAPVS